MRLRRFRAYFLYGAYAVPVWLIVGCAAILLLAESVSASLHIQIPQARLTFHFWEPNRAKLFMEVLANTVVLGDFLAWFYIIRAIRIAKDQLDLLALQNSGPALSRDLRRLVVEQRLPLWRLAKIIPFS